MAGYRTEQKKMLLAYLQANGKDAHGIEELSEGMRAMYGELSPGVSTVYRLMDRLVKEGTVKRFPNEQGRGFVYQIVAGRTCRSHLHLKCLSCGRLLHMDETLSEELVDRLLSVCGFSLCEEETVLFGACEACRREGTVE
ncbi:MAG: transcriptional repressor [Clostridia bacterium]|nr:transcriptional repressor [Clostridia bacterium]